MASEPQEAAPETVQVTPAACRHYLLDWVVSLAEYTRRNKEIWTIDRLFLWTRSPIEFLVSKFFLHKHVISIIEKENFAQKSKAVFWMLLQQFESDIRGANLTAKEKEAQRIFIRFFDRLKEKELRTITPDELPRRQQIFFDQFSGLIQALWMTASRYYAAAEWNKRTARRSFKQVLELYLPDDSTLLYFLNDLLHFFEQNGQSAFDLFSSLDDSTHFQKYQNIVINGLDLEPVQAANLWWSLHYFVHQTKRGTKNLRVLFFSALVVTVPVFFWMAFSPYRRDLAELLRTLFTDEEFLNSAKL